MAQLVVDVVVAELAGLWDGVLGHRVHHGR
jgi:hypothetical protein